MSEKNEKFSETTDLLEGKRVVRNGKELSKEEARKWLMAVGKQVRLDLDVYAKLMELANPEDKANDVIRRLLEAREYFRVDINR